MARCPKCDDTGWVFVMEDPAEFYENPEDMTIEEMEEEGLAGEDFCECETGLRMQTEYWTSLEDCLLPGKKVEDLPDPPFRFCEWFDMERFEAHVARFASKNPWEEENHG